MPFVMVVDDEVVMRDLLSLVFATESWRVATARHGQELIAHVERGDKPDLIVLDLMMPVMDGQATAEWILADGRWADVPIVVLSALSSLRRAHLPFAAAVWQKPFDVPELLDLCAAIVDRGNDRVLPVHNWEADDFHET